MFLIFTFDATFERIYLVALHNEKREISLYVWFRHLRVCKEGTVCMV